MPVTTEQLDKLFEDFTKAGYFAKQNFMCCTSCGTHALPKRKRKYVFYHSQDANDIVDGILICPLHLAWGGNGEKICNIIRKNGLIAVWDGSNELKIKIVPEFEPVNRT